MGILKNGQPENGQPAPRPLSPLDAAFGPELRHWKGKLIVRVCVDSVRPHKPRGVNICK